MTTPSIASHDANERFVIAEIRGRVGCITLNRPQALNALSLDMIRSLTSALQRWRDDPMVLAVVLRGMGKEGPFGAFCAGGDIRFFHQAALTGDEALEAFFTEEYTLNHLIHTYAKPLIAFMDGIVMGGGMGISQGASLRVVTERTKLAMPETAIGLFPDVGGGYFLSRCPGHVGEYLGLTGRVLGGMAALGVGLAAIAGMIAAPLASVYPGMGSSVLIMCFVVVVIGGIGSVRGALVAALLVGLVDTFGKVLVPQIAGMAVYMLMALVLLYKPEGLFKQ